MKIITKISELSAYKAGIEAEHSSFGLVPTMGALHSGHGSLVQRSKQENDYTIVSVFVNPTQFNDPEDLKKYPRTPEKDIEYLESLGCDAVFMPSVEEIYPEKDTRQFTFSGIENLWEGAFRPGHFNGVAQIVSKLFTLIPAHRAYFGEKDYQQMLIICELAKQMNIRTQIVPCSIIREEDGLAKSSRNVRLTTENRTNAPKIYQLLLTIRDKAYANQSIDELKSFMATEISKIPNFKLDYFSIVDANNLREVSTIQPNQCRALIALYAGDI